MHDRFLADHMLRRLARWLRIMGFDVSYPEKGASDTSIMARCKKEKRVLLTRDAELYSRYPESILVRSDDFRKQALQFLSHYPSESDAYFTRCPECNAVLNRMEGFRNTAAIPESVRKYQDEVLSCPNCGKAYWKGSHYWKIKEQIERLEQGSP